ncbi:jg2587 [Pararge aegeria aegeria]|uniref:Jg2587 protein n=1 Tax=Pararge aegeria aegeria TaxID=348720 RepID=A0A8S4QFN5_9NEOP|nr:jg2587 [Pararge aegeria aegeria]
MLRKSSGVRAHLREDAEERVEDVLQELDELVVGHALQAAQRLAQRVLRVVRAPLQHAEDLLCGTTDSPNRGFGNGCEGVAKGALQFTTLRKDQLHTRSISLLEMFIVHLKTVVQ